MKGLERLCAGPNQTDWIAVGPERASQNGVQRIEACFASHGYDPHRHDTYSLGFTIAGVQSFDYRGARRDSLPGQAIVLHPDEVHDGRAGNELGFHYRMLYIEPRLVQAALGEKASTLPFIKNAVSNDALLQSSISAALDDLSRPLEPLEVDQLVLTLSDAMLRLDSGAQTRKATVSSSFAVKAVERARELIDAEAIRGVSSAEIERCTGLDRYELCRHFRRLLGTSPHRYLTLRRLTHAKEGIETGQALGEVAHDCGFADQSHMTRAFKRAFGMPPGQYQTLVANGRSAGL